MNFGQGRRIDLPLLSAGLSQAEPHSLIVFAFNPPAETRRLIDLAQDAATQLADPLDRRGEIVDSEEHLEMRRIVASMNADRQRGRVHLARTGHAPPQQLPIERPGCIRIADTQLDIARLTRHSE